MSSDHMLVKLRKVEKNRRQSAALAASGRLRRWGKHWREDSRENGHLPQHAGREDILNEKT